jgi:hypothetical protein
VNHPDELDRLLSSPAHPLAPPAGLFERVRRRAARRRRARAALPVSAVAVVAGVGPPVALQLGADPGTPSPSVGDPSPSARTGPRCRTGGLRVSLGRIEAAAGSRYAMLVLANTSGRPCRLVGHPRVSAVDAAGHPLGPVASPAPGNPRRRLELFPGAVASTVLHWAGHAAGPCRPESTYLRVYPPGAGRAATVHARVQLCGDVFDVRDLTRGSAGPAR